MIMREYGTQELRKRRTRQGMDKDDAGSTPADIVSTASER
jgi:hypothetical protein